MYAVDLELFNYSTEAFEKAAEAFTDHLEEPEWIKR